MATTHQQAASTAVRQQTQPTARRWRISGMEGCRAPATRAEMPCDSLQQNFTRYEIWSPQYGTEIGNPTAALWVLPGEARLLLVEPGAQASALIGNRHYDVLPHAVLFGPSSRATRLDAQGGSIVMVGVSALGWAGIVRRSAAALGDRAVCAAEMLEGWVVAALAGALEAGCEEGIAERLDSVLGMMPLSRCRDEPLVTALTEIIERSGVCAAEEAVGRLGVASHVARRSAIRHFGYPPKVLLNRRRFVRALEGMILADRGYSEATRHGYFDASHFIRDARRFLGMTPRRFLALAS